MRAFLGKMFHESWKIGSFVSKESHLHLTWPVE
jgi:hypothetical protein